MGLTSEFCDQTGQQILQKEFIWCEPDYWPNLSHLNEAKHKENRRAAQARKTKTSDVIDREGQDDDDDDDDDEEDEDEEDDGSQNVRDEK